MTPVNIPHTKTEPFQAYLHNKGSKMISAQELMQFKISPKHYEYCLKDKQFQVSQIEEDRLRTAMYQFLNDKDNFYNIYRRIANKELPNQNRGRYHDAITLNENIKYRDQTLPESFPGTTALWEDQYDLIESTFSKVYQNEMIRDLFKGGKFGVSSYMTDEKTGLILKSRCHFLPQKGLFHFAITPNAEPKFYTKRIFYDDINNIVAFKQLVFQRDSYILIAIEENPPYVVQPFILDQDTIYYSNQENRMLLDILYWSKKRGVYVNYAQFEKLKKLYKEGDCYQQDIKITFDYLDCIYKEAIYDESNTVEILDWQTSTAAHQVEPGYHFK